MNIKKLLGKRLKAIREGHNYTQEMLAEKLDMSTNAISLVERGINFISPDLLEKLCKIYNVKPEFFFKFDTEFSNSDVQKTDEIIKHLKTLSSTDLLYVYKFIKSLN